MSGKLYFRVREGGAQVFRVDEAAPDGRLRLEPLANVSLRSGDIRAQGGRDVSGAERAEIECWIARRRDMIDSREVDDLRRTVEAMQAAAHWVQSRADDAAIRAVADDLLLALHDLRTATVRRLSDLERGD